MQFKVPQNIDMADRIVGPLTLVQFLYLLVGGIVIYFLFSIIAPVNPLLFAALAFPIGFFTFALAFLKIQDQPFPSFVAAFFIYLSRPKMRIWSKDTPDPEMTITPDDTQKKAAVEHKTIKKSELDSLIQVLDTGGVPADRHPVEAPAKSRLSTKPFTPPNHLKTSRPVLDNVRKQHGAK